jgi:predicted aspartyl protease
MGRIVSSVTINNISDSSKTLRCDALVDTGTSFLVLPDAWRDRLGDLEIRTSTSDRLF